MKAWDGKGTIAITLYYSIFNGNINFWLKCFLLVIIPFLVVTSILWLKFFYHLLFHFGCTIFINFWMVIFSTYYSFTIAFLVVKVVNRLRQFSLIGYRCIVVFLKVASLGHSCLMYLSMIWIFLSTLFSKALYWLTCFLPVFIPFLVIIFSNFWWKYFYLILFLYYSTFGFSKFSKIEIFGKTINLLVSWSLKAMGSLIINNLNN